LRGLKSSPYDPYVLGYTRVTKGDTKSYLGANYNKSLKTPPVQIVFCNSKA